VDALPQVRVGFLHIGETTVGEARAAILAQRGVAPSIVEVADLPQWEAHRQLYGALDRDSKAHAMLAKVDGDMVLREPWLFWVIHRLYERRPDVDRITVGVTDWFSGRAIDGLVTWRGGVRWTGEPDPVRPDHIPTTVRASLKLTGHGRHLVDHGEGASRTQAIRYGAHRGRKARLNMTRIRIADATAFVSYVGREPHPLRSLAVAAVEFGIEHPGPAAALVSGDVSDDDADGLERRASEPGLVERTLRLLDDLETERRALKEVARQPMSERRPHGAMRARIASVVTALSGAARQTNVDPPDPSTEAMTEFIALLDGATERP